MLIRQWDTAEELYNGDHHLGVTKKYGTSHTSPIPVVAINHKVYRSDDHRNDWGTAFESHMEDAFLEREHGHPISISCAFREHLYI